MKGNLRVLAFHLPQFHEIPENNEWWGEGFTEWTNTKKSKPLYKMHNQPRTPYKEDYYDLTDEKALKRQMSLAKKAGLDGFCYYHYWFDGKLLLEKPLEIMRKLDERIPYCFCWANEPWIRSWEGSREVLVEQNYPGEEDWKKHFDYFLDFFKDEKYIKVDNKPVLVLYKTKSITDCDDMVKYWDERCRKEGFDGIYIVEELNGFQDEAYSSESKAYLEFEPLFSIKFGRNKKDKTVDYAVKTAFNLLHGTKCLMYSYKRIWKNILNRRHKEFEGKSICLGAFVDWDNTPRRAEHSTFFYGAKPSQFEKYMRLQIKNAEELDSPFIFINAWNEWGEGTYLEPDMKYGYGYLKALQRVMGEESDAE